MKFFKGFAVHGPEAPGELSEEFAKIPQDLTLDSISGNFKLFQYIDGHRFSTDDLLVAWYGTTNAPSSSTVLDLGSGIGTVATIAAWRLIGAQFVTVEVQEISVTLALKSCKYNGLDKRFDIRCGDFRDAEILKNSEKFDLILGSPPYFPLENGVTSENEQKTMCRFEFRGNISDYCKVASQHLTTGGVFACIFPIEPGFQEQRVIDAAKESFLSIVKRRNVVLKEGQKPILGLFMMMDSEDLPKPFREITFHEPNLTIRSRDGSVNHEYSTIKISIGFQPY